MEGEAIQAIVRETTHGDDLLQMIQYESWDLVILDVNLPGRGQTYILNELQEKFPGLPVLMIGMDSEDHYAEFVLRAGACGYINIQNAPEILAATIQSIFPGHPASVQDSKSQKPVRGRSSQDTIKNKG